MRGVVAAAVLTVLKQLNRSIEVIHCGRAFRSVADITKESTGTANNGFELFAIVWNYIGNDLV